MRDTEKTRAGEERTIVRDLSWGGVGAGATPPISLASKKRVYSPARIRFPMKRVDFDPSGVPGSTGPGGRNIQNRGTSKYVRITWDEALDIITSEMNRIKET